MPQRGKMEHKILIIDDDQSQLHLLKAGLAKRGYNVTTLSNPSDTLEHMAANKPDVVLVDLMMPETDGFAVMKNIKSQPEFADVKIIVLSSKSFAHDESRALSLGANLYITKPVPFEVLKEKIDRIVSNTVVVKCWGARGTYPTPQAEYLKYGGNTPCFSVEFSKGETFIFDAGTGIINLGNSLASEKRKLKLNLLISHPHWDHIQGFPFFKPAFMQGNEIAVYGSAHGDISLREAISGQMESIYFPITIREFASRLYFKEIREASQTVDGISVKTILLNHPGNTLGFRLTDNSGKSVAYITDNELPPKEMGGMDQFFRDKLVTFLKGVDLLIHDTTYFDEEYKSHVGWGHSPVSEVLGLARDAGAKSLCIFHHDPAHTDAMMDEMDAFAKKFVADNKLAMTICTATEQTVFRI